MTINKSGTIYNGRAVVYIVDSNFNVVAKTVNNTSHTTSFDVTVNTSTLPVGTYGILSMLYSSDGQGTNVDGNLFYGYFGTLIIG